MRWIAAIAGFFLIFIFPRDIEARVSKITLKLFKIQESQGEWLFYIHSTYKSESKARNSRFDIFKRNKLLRTFFREIILHNKFNKSQKNKLR